MRYYNNEQDIHNHRLNFSFINIILNIKMILYRVYFDFHLQVYKLYNIYVIY